MCWGLFSLTSHFKGLGEATEAHQRDSNFPFSSIVLTALQCISLQQFVCKRDRVQLTSSIASVELWWKIAPRVLFFLPKHTRMRPSHSLKLTGGGGFLGSMRTTLLSTLGGGLKLFLPTCMAGHTYHREIQQASECTDRSIPAATANLSSAQGVRATSGHTDHQQDGRRQVTETSGIVSPKPTLAVQQDIGSIAAP